MPKPWHRSFKFHHKGATTTSARRTSIDKLIFICRTFAITNIPITIQFICRCYTCSLLNVGLQAETQEIGGVGSHSLKYWNLISLVRCCLPATATNCMQLKRSAQPPLFLFCSSNIFCFRTFFTSIFAECEQPLRENFCLNGGTCFRLPGEGPPTDPNCVCRTGYTGHRCEETVIDFRKSLVDDF